MELERSAGRAQARGGLAAAAAFLQRAVALTRRSRPAHRPRARRRRGRACRRARSTLAHGMLATAEVGPLDELQRARLDLLRAEAAYAESRGSEAPALLLRAAKTLEPLDPRLARETYLDAWSSALFAGRLASRRQPAPTSRARRWRRRDRRAPARPSDLLLEGFALAFTDGRAAAAPVLARAATGFAGRDVSIEEVLRWGWLATAAAAMVWDYETCRAVADARGRDRPRGRRAERARRQRQRDGAGRRARRRVRRRPRCWSSEAEGVTEATGTHVAPYGALVLAGLQGREAAAAGLIDATIRGVHGRRAGHRGPVRALGAVAAPQRPRPLSRRRWPRPRRRATTRRSCSSPSGRRSSCSRPRRGADEPEVADARRYERIARGHRRSPPPTGRSGSGRGPARCGARARPPSALYREAIERLGRTRLRPELARTHLLYGEWLRREHRRVDARAQLRAAHDQLTAIGMEAFAERARRRAAGDGREGAQAHASRRATS